MQEIHTDTFGRNYVWYYLAPASFDANAALAKGSAVIGTNDLHRAGVEGLNLASSGSNAVEVIRAAVGAALAKAVASLALRSSCCGINTSRYCLTWRAWWPM